MAELTDTSDLREIVRRKYAAAATAEASGCSCCGSTSEAHVFGASLYAESGETGAPEAAISASLGCGVPTAGAAIIRARKLADRRRP